MKHHIAKTLLVIFTLISTNYSCSDDKDETHSLQVSINRVTEISPKGKSGTFDILSNTNWTITDIPDWISLSKTSGTDNARISYAVAPYATTSEDARTATLTIKSPNIAETYRIEFSQYSPNTYFLTTDAKESYVVPYTGDTISFNIKSNTSWEIDRGSENWLTTSVSKGEGDAAITIKVDKLKETVLESRVAKIILTGKGVSKPADTLTVIQTPQFIPDLTVDQDSIKNIKPVRTQVEFSITSTSSKKWIITDIPDWISLSEKEGVHNKKITANISALPEDVNQRAATLIITLDKSIPEIKAQITLTQVYKENYYDKIPDKNFRNKVIERLKYLGISVENNFFTKSDIERIEYLELNNINSIEGLEFFSNLKTLRLYSTNLPSVSIKEGSNLLKTISLLGSNIKNIHIDEAVNVEEITYTNKNEYSFAIDCSTLKSLSIADCPSGINLNIEKATNLRELICYGSRLNELNIVNNKLLESISCSSCELTALAIDNPNLEKISYVYNEKLTTLDLSKAPNLKTIRCESNSNLANLILDNPKLEAIDCFYNNKLKTLDLDRSPLLKTLNCFSNPILNKLVVNSNNLSDLHCGTNNLTSLDVSRIPNLITLSCDDNNLTNLTINNPKLTRIYCNNNELVNLDISNAPSLNSVECNNNKLTDLIINNPNLEKIICKNNELINLDLSKAPNLNSIKCENNKLTALTINNPKLETIICENNKLTSINFNSAPSLTSLKCSNNELSHFDISKAPNLIRLECENNALTNLTINNPKIEHISCTDNELVNLDVSKAPNLDFLYCPRNKLTNLVIDNPRLTNINCCYNELPTLDISKAPNLTQIYCHYNKLTSLTLNNPNLKHMYCVNNGLTSLDISKSTKLENLNCDDNPLSTLFVWWDGGYSNKPSDFDSFDIPDGVSFIKK